jgi:hypothetical protein
MIDHVRIAATIASVIRFVTRKLVFEPTWMGYRIRECKERNGIGRPAVPRMGQRSFGG